MHTPGKGMSGSALPYKRTPPSWLKMTATEVRLELVPLLAAVRVTCLQLLHGKRGGGCRPLAAPADQRP